MRAMAAAMRALTSLMAHTLHWASDTLSGALSAPHHGSNAHSLHRASSSERDAAMHGTMPISRLRLGPRKPAPLLRAVPGKDKELLGTKPRKTVAVKLGDTLADISGKHR